MTDLDHRVPGLTVAVSGSFKRHLSAVQDAVEGFQARGLIVLSPAEPTVVDSFGDFLFVSSDRRRSIKGVQNRHLSAIENSSFLWLCCPDGYVGQSAAMEIGFAVAVGVPVYSDSVPADLTLRQYCTVASTIDNCLLMHSAASAPEGPKRPDLLVYPEATLATIQGELATIEAHLLHDRRALSGDPVEDSVSRLHGLLRVPSKK